MFTHSSVSVNIALQVKLESYACVIIIVNYKKRKLKRIKCAFKSNETQFSMLPATRIKL